MAMAMAWASRQTGPGPPAARAAGTRGAERGAGGGRAPGGASDFRGPVGELEAQRAVAPEPLRSGPPKMRGFRPFSHERPARSSGSNSGPKRALREAVRPSAAGSVRGVPQAPPPTLSTADSAAAAAECACACEVRRLRTGSTKRSTAGSGRASRPLPFGGARICPGECIDALGLVVRGWNVCLCISRSTITGSVSNLLFADKTCNVRW